MPNRTIYVADVDLPIFEKAQQLAGDNLSSAIAHALRRFVESEEAKAGGFEEITVKVGKGHPYFQKQFRGRLLAKRRIRMQNGTRWLRLEVYQTARGRFALYSRNTPDWSSWTNQSKQSDWSKKPGCDWSKWDETSFDWSSYYEENELRLDVYEALEDLKENIPEDLYETINHYLQGGDIEILDI